MNLDEFRERRRNFTRVVGVSECETEQAITEQAQTGLDVLVGWLAEQDDNGAAAADVLRLWDGGDLDE